jgi:hypothetical protein
MRAALLLVVLAACGSDNVDLTGMYQVTADVSSMPCGTDTAVAMAPAYLKFHKQNFVGTDYFVYDECNDAAGTDCPNSGGLFGMSFTTPVANGWSTSETFSSSSGGNCTLGYVTASALLMGKALVIDSTEYSDNVMLADPQCTTTEAGKRGKTMPCAMHSRIDAMKL